MKRPITEAKVRVRIRERCDFLYVSLGGHILSHMLLTVISVKSSW